MSAVRKITSMVPCSYMKETAGSNIQTGHHTIDKAMYKQKGIAMEEKAVITSDQARETLGKIQSLEEMISMKGKVAVVAGGSYGMGYNLAYRYAEAGAKVVITARKEDKCKAAVADFKSLGYDVDYVTADICDVDQCYAAIDYAENKYGKVDILAVIAAYQELLAFLDVDEERYDRMIDTNVKGTYFMCQAAARSMVRNGVEGYIVTCSSTASVGSDSAMAMMSHYAASKGAVNALTHAMARELAQHNIHVNCVACGNMKSTGQDANGPRVYADYGADCALLGQAAAAYPEIPKSETPDDMASVAFFLSTPMARFVFGDTVFADGGLRFCSGIPTATMSKFIKSLSENK